MRRWFLSLICLLLGALSVLLGWLVPIHLRAVDSRLLQKAGKNTPSVVERGLGLVDDKRLGAARMLFDAATTLGLPETQRLGAAIKETAELHPSWQIWGGGESDLEVLFTTDPKLPKVAPEPVTDWVIRLDNRGTALRLSNASGRELVKELLNTRSITNTTLFPPSQSASGQAFDAAVTICAMLAEENRFSPAFSNVVYNLASQANRGAGSQPFEEMLMDVMSLGQRMNWGQLVVFTHRIEDTETLRQLAYDVRRNESRLPILYSAVEMSGQPAAVSSYLSKFGQTGIKDLGEALRHHKGGLNELLRQNEPVYAPTAMAERLSSGILNPFFEFAVGWSLQTPRCALGLKWFLYLFGGFLLAMAGHVIRGAPTDLERPLQVRGLHLAREALFGIGFLVVVLMATEPFLSQESQKVEFPLRLRLPGAGAVVKSVIAAQKQTFMNQKSLLTLVLFFVLQGLIYIACLVKLAEVRRQKVSPRVKLRLLENEEHLFDAGLYLGFAGTVVSLILVSLGVLTASLMAAYGSTAFGMVFVSIFKIFHLRPLRRKLVLESEANSDAPMMVRPVHSTP